MTKFYISIVKVEGSGEYTVKALVEKIKKAIHYVYAHRLITIIEKDNTIQVIHIEPR